MGYAAKYQHTYKATFYAFAFSGSHIHLLGRFAAGTRAPFYRDFGARTAEAVRFLCPEFPGGPLFERRYSEQAVPTNEDVFEQFFYVVLQPVLAGLTQRISDYPGYNCFHDASFGIEREFKVIDWAGYTSAKRHSKQVRLAQYTTTYELKFKRLPGFEHLTRSEYRNMLLSELEMRRAAIVARWLAEGHRYPSPEDLAAVIPGTPAKNPKRSTRFSKRPLVLTKCEIAKKNFLALYFTVYNAYKRAVKKYLAGDRNAEFPPGTYKPPGPFVPMP